MDKDITSKKNMIYERNLNKHIRTINPIKEPFILHIYHLNNVKATLYSNLILINT